MKQGILLLALAAIFAVCSGYVDSQTTNYQSRDNRWETDLAAVSITGNPTPQQGIQSVYQISIFNNGSSAQSNYQVRLFFFQDINVIATVNGTLINPGETVHITIPWTPQNYGESYIYARVLLTGDQNNANNQTPNFNVIIQPGTGWDWIGAGNELARVPVDMFYKNSLFECLYYPTEMANLSGIITGVKFLNNFSTSILMNMPTNVWLGTTTQTDLNSGWIPSTQLTQVFNGTVNYPMGENLISIDFTTPFLYPAQQNLVLLMQRPMDTQYYSSNDKFQAQTATINRARRAFNDNEILNPASPPTTGSATGLFPRTLFVIQPIAQVIVSGVIVDGNSGSGLSEAVISLSGVANYTATTNASGQFSIPGVYANNTYTYTISRGGYQTASGSILVGTEDYNCGNLTLFPLAYPPQNVQAVVLENNTQVQISWLPPEFGTLLGYRVWRLHAGEEANEAIWFMLTTGAYLQQSILDNAWDSLPDGNYRWAVKAIYANSVISEAAFSNTLQKPAYWGNLQGMVTNSLNQTILGASITAGAYSTITGASGAYDLPLPVGVYTVIVDAQGYIGQTVEDVYIWNAETTTFNFTLQADSATDDEITQLTPTQLLGNYPNPFNPETTISYILYEPAFVNLKIYNQRGQLLRSLIHASMESGKHHTVWDGRDESGAVVGSGIYLYTLQAGSRLFSRKMLILK